MPDASIPSVDDLVSELSGSDGRTFLPWGDIKVRISNFLQGSGKYPIPPIEYYKLAVLLRFYCNVNSIPVPSELSFIESDIPTDKARNPIVAAFHQIANYHTRLDRKDTLDAFQGKLSTTFKAGFAYEFSDGDLKRIQELINHLRTLVTQTKEMEEGHRQRVLKRLEKLQSELHKRMSDIDCFWGLMGDAGEALGKFGRAAKPITDTVIEILKIVWSTQSRALELPSGTPIPMITDQRTNAVDKQ